MSGLAVPSAEREALAQRLASLPGLADIPLEELRWLAEFGRVETHEAGEILAPRGQPIPKLWILLSGRVTVRVDRGAGLRRVISWGPGDVTGMLPYSRMKTPPGNNMVDEAGEFLAVRREIFREMIHRCPTFTAYTVHRMLDRARSFKASDLQDDKLISLGKLAAGMAHELNNPASALARGAQVLREGLAAADGAARRLGTAGLTPDQFQAIEAIRDVCQARVEGHVLTAIQQADREDEIAVWLEEHDADTGLAEALAETAVTLEALDELAAAIPSGALDPTLAWVASGCTAHALASDIESAARRIHELVGAVKRFTYMDRLGDSHEIDVAAGLRDTVRVLASKARARNLSVTMDLPDALPPVKGIGGELNQVWMNLLDNAMDAAPEGGHVEVSACVQGTRIAVCVADDGPGIEEEVLPRIFDAFFTTKAPGQGTGLGLEIARRIARGHRGDVTVESRPGRTEFRVELPVG